MKCACGGGRARSCETCGRFVCPECRAIDVVIIGIMYIECKPCVRGRGAWNNTLRSDKQFMRWYGFRRYSPTPPERKERTPQQ